MENKRGKYQGLSLPTSLLDEIKKHIEKHREYKSVTDFVRESIRGQMKQESSKYLGTTGIAIKEYLLKTRTLDKKVNVLTDNMESIVEKLDKVVIALENKK